MMKDLSEAPCPTCGEPCPVERLDQHVEIIDCCGRKWVVRVDGVLASRFRNEVSNEATN